MATTVCGITVSDFGIFGINMLGVTMGKVGVSTVSLVIDTEGSCGSFMGVEVTISDGDDTDGDDGVDDVTVAVLLRIGAIVMFLRPTFFNIVAALLEICFNSGSSFLSSFSGCMFCRTVPPLPCVAEG